MLDYNAAIHSAHAQAELRAKGIHPRIAAHLVEKHGYEKIFQLLREELHVLAALVREVERLEGMLEPEPASAVLFFQTSTGETSMPLTVHLNDKPGTAVYKEFAGPNGTGQVVPAKGTVSYQSSDPTVATVDPSTGALVYLKAGTTVISASDGGSLPASDTLTVNEPIAVSSTLTLNAGQ